MRVQPIPNAAEHPLDVFEFLSGCLDKGQPVALCVLTATQGGAVRAPGALMAVSADGDTFGYLSGGCIDNDIVVHSQDCLEKNIARTLRYGAQSPYLDISLPCGGAIDVLILPCPEKADISFCVRTMTARKALSVDYDMTGLFAETRLSEPVLRAVYRPKLKVRIAGRGADPLALARLCLASGIDVSLWTPEEATANAGAGIKGLNLVRLTSPQDIPRHDDDTETAFILMFHDRDWETDLLISALGGTAFFIGAVGSHRTHAARVDRLLARGVKKESAARIYGPVGLVPSMRNASMLAVSTLAHIVDVFHGRPEPEPFDP